MENRYDKVMNNIEVSPEMRQRILNTVNNLDLDKIPNKVVPFRNYKKYLAIAACFVFLLAGSTILHNRINMPNNEPPILVAPDIVEFSSAAELSEDIGFRVKEIQEVPFEVEAVKYISSWGDLAEVQYTGKNNTVILRMALGSEDISGDYSEYASIETHSIEGHEVTIKGNDGKYRLAVWQSEGFSYAVQCSEAVSEQELLTIIKSIQ